MGVDRLGDSKYKRKSKIPLLQPSNIAYSGAKASMKKNLPFRLDFFHQLLCTVFMLIKRRRARENLSKLLLPTQKETNDRKRTNTGQL